MKNTSFKRNYLEAGARRPEYVAHDEAFGAMFGGQEFGIKRGRLWHSANAETNQTTQHK